MLFVRACSTVFLTAALLATPAFAGRSHRTPTSGHHHKKKAVSHKVQGQRGIDSDRAREIQTALIKQNYLSGEPSGQWDAETQAAMEKYQADNGWQTRLIPDSRALIKLGLGPDHAGALPSSGTTQDASIPDSPTPAVAEANTLAAAHSIQN